MRKQVNFRGFECYVDFGVYGNGRTAIKLTDIEDGSPVAIATVNLPNEPLEVGEVIIKNYSENEGVLEVLVKAEIISPPFRVIPLTFVEASVCQLLVNTNE